MSNLQDVPPSAPYCASTVKTRGATIYLKPASKVGKFLDAYGTYLTLESGQNLKSLNKIIIVQTIFVRTVQISCLYNIQNIQVLVGVKTLSQMDVAPWCYKWMDWDVIDWMVV